MTKCRWALASALEEHYHDHEWGQPQHDDAKLFEFLILEGAQAGLSWRTILAKRAAYRQAFADFSPEKVAEFDSLQLQALLENPGIIRNRLKIAAAITNARAFLQVQQQFGSFDTYIWQFVDGQPLQNHWLTHEQLPAFTPLSVQISRDLQQRGFKFVGKTITYAFMQATGMVNDHTQHCFRYQQLASSPDAKLV